MSEEGGCVSKDRLFVNEIPSFANDVNIAFYNEDKLHEIVADSPENGFTLMILPAFSKVHSEYAMKAPFYEGIFFKAITGWISGVHLDDLGSASPLVFNGMTGESSGEMGVVMHVTLPEDYQSNIVVINIFDKGDGDEIWFPKGGFETTDCLVNNKKRNFHDYILENKIDTRLPLVSDFCGTMVNVSIQGLNEKDRSVNFYAPVFEGVVYKFAQPVNDYAARFQTAVDEKEGTPAFACNCILNFLYGELEGKKTGAITGPITFGEIAYQLLNQTMVCLEVNKL
jgi:hypothetical protein